jgi:DNA-directed RNA polymerase subunit RPC12/RpoP
MVACAYCEKPLICDDCRAEYVPPTPEHYLALSQRDALLRCTHCGAVLVCHWCKTPYDGDPDGEADAGA